MDHKRLDSSQKDFLIAAQAETIRSQAATNATLTAQVAMLLARVAELEAKLSLPPKTPENSSIPPSKGQKPGSKPDNETKSRPKTRAHPGVCRELHPNPTAQRDIRAQACQHCGTDVSGLSQIACQTYDHIEIPVTRPDITRVTLRGGVCPCCAKNFRAGPPADMPGGSPFGPNLRAYVIYLRFTQNIALERLATLLFDFFGLEISEGALVNMLNAAQKPFASAANAIKARLLAGTALQSDETGMRVGKNNWWFWVFHHGKDAVFVCEPTRGKIVVETFLGPFRPEYWVSDRYAGQLGFATKANQVCLAHLIREAQYGVDAGDTIFAPRLRHLLGLACRIGAHREKLKDSTLKAYLAKLDKKLDVLMATQPVCARGLKLQAMILRTRCHLFTFMTNRAIPPTNNGSERALRPSAVFRKVTNGFRTGWGSQLYANVRSVTETGRRNTIGALEAISQALKATPMPKTA